MSRALFARARSWLEQDPDPETRAELAGLLRLADAGDGAALADLEDRFRSRLAFGTAGLRGALGAGSNRMNRVLVAQAAAGFAAYLQEASVRARSDAAGAVPRSDAAAAPSIVIGYDGRRNSHAFAVDSAELFAGAGLRAILLPRLLPTPVLAFAVRHLGADAGVMVTASHNPPGDNGYKVYLGGADAGAQIVAPADAEITAHIRRIADLDDVRALPRSTAYETADEAVLEAYVSETAAVASAPRAAADLRWTYTAMHGVGWETFARVVERAGFPEPSLVAAQLDPDPAFPTLAFPNPEEPGALDLANTTASEAGAELIVSHDPDADRLAVAIPAGEGWRRLTGNEVGLLLGWRAARAASPGAALASSLVSSPGLREVATHHGLAFHETLTGFKWISRAPGIVYGYEEALGYLVNPETVRDKDGISAALAMLSLAAEAKGRGTDLGGLLDEFAATFGHFASGQVAIRVDEVTILARIMAALRADPPTAIGSAVIEEADDLLDGAGELPPGDVLRYRLADDARLIVRPSGTEPKLKLYLDVRGTSSADAAARLAALERDARALLDGLG